MWPGQTSWQLQFSKSRPSARHATADASILRSSSADYKPPFVAPALSFIQPLLSTSRAEERRGAREASQALRAGCPQGQAARSRGRRIVRISSVVCCVFSVVEAPADFDTSDPSQARYLAFHETNQPSAAELASVLLADDGIGPGHAGNGSRGTLSFSRRGFTALRIMR